MKTPDLFRLSLKQFESNIKSNLKQLQVEKDFCDVTLACEDQQIEAHKVILAGGSLIFKNLLKQHPHPHPLIFLRGTKFSDLSRMLDFMYQGQIRIDQNQLNDFLSVAQEFRIIGLTEETLDEPKRSEHFVEDGLDDVKRKRPRLFSNSSKQDLDDEDIKLEIDDSEPVTQEVELSAMFENDDDFSEDGKDGKDPLQTCISQDKDVEKFADQLIVKRQLSFVSGDHNSNDQVELFPYSCEHCDYKVSTKKSFNYHMKSRHEGVRYPCDQCDLTFTSRSGVNRHVMSIHMKIRFPCEYCDYTATRLEQVKRHVKSAHDTSQ